MTLFSSATSKSGKIKKKGKKTYLHSYFIGHAERKSLVSLEGDGRRGRKIVIS